VIQIALQICLAFALTAVLLLLLRRPAMQAGLVDQPTSRKRHGRAVPLIGGVCITIGFVAAALPADLGLRDYQGLFAGMGTLLLLGIVDDLVEVDSRARLGIQILAALLMAAWGGLHVEDLGALLGPGTSLSLGPWAIPFTVLCVVGLINAVNMFDGVDGLAAGTVAIALGWLVLAGAVGGAGAWPVLAGLLLAAISAFLVFNLRNPWRRQAACFLGDSGSTAIGFGLAWLAVEAAAGTAPVLPPIAIAWILALPVSDAITLMARRALRGVHPFRPDRKHLHHIFYRAGFTPGQTVSILLVASAVLGGIGVLGAWAGVPEWLLLLLLLPVAAGQALIHARAWRIARLLGRYLRRARSRGSG